MSTPQETPDQRQLSLSLPASLSSISQPMPAAAILASGKLLDTASTVVVLKLSPQSESIVAAETSTLPAAMHATFGIPLGSLLVAALTIALVWTTVRVATTALDAVAAASNLPTPGTTIRDVVFVTAGVAFASLAVHNLIVFST
ncbi:hypothetical protein [Salinibaculum salinum]|uniref:hypothetical protein n=1 Tax=Salinibaculum salinum TaxID=3131996 RepID=UPI0030ECBD44